ncbi:MAG: hypothetical protein Q7S47_02330, partial [bacterium]|nr:hypothetical protein [bacterium]
MPQKLFTITLWAFVIAALFFVYAGKNKTFGKLILAKELTNDSYLSGDLYAYSKVDAFKEHIKETKLREDTTITNSATIIMGDSFFNTGYDSDPVPNKLQKALGEKIFYRATSKQDLAPSEYLQKFGYTKGDPGIFIWETIERKSLDRALSFTDSRSKNFQNATSTPISSKGASLNHALFDRIDIEYVIKNNRFVRPIDRWLKNQTFRWF